MTRVFASGTGTAAAYVTSSSPTMGSRLQETITKVVKSLALPLLLASRAHATFFEAIGGTGDDQTFGVAPKQGGGFITVGMTPGTGGYDIQIINASETGAILSSRTAGGAGVDKGVGIVRSPLGSMRVLTSTTSAGAGNEDGAVFEVWPNGTIGGAKVFGTSAANTPWGITVASDNGTAVAGSTGIYSFIVKFNSTLNLEWAKTQVVAGPYYSNGYGITSTSDGIVVVGSTNWNLASYDALAMYFANNGTIFWKQVYGIAGGSDNARSVICDASKCIMGGLTTLGAGSYDFFILEIALATGALQKAMTVGTSSDDRLFSLAFTDNGNGFVATGSTGYGSASGGAMVTKFVNWTHQWTRVINGTGGDISYSGIISESQDIAVGGVTGSGAGSNDGFLTLMSTNGMISDCSYLQSLTPSISNVTASVTSGTTSLGITDLALSLSDWSMTVSTNSPTLTQVCAPPSTTGVATTGVATTGVATTGVATTGVATTGVQTTGVQTTGVATTGVATTGVATTGVQTTGVLTTGVATTGVATTGVHTTGVATTGVQTTGIATTGVATTGNQTTGIGTTGVATTGTATTGAKSPSQPSPTAPIKGNQQSTPSGTPAWVIGTAVAAGVLACCSVIVAFFVALIRRARKQNEGLSTVEMASFAPPQRASQRQQDYGNFTQEGHQYGQVSSPSATAYEEPPADLFAGHPYENVESTLDQSVRSAPSGVARPHSTHYAGSGALGQGQAPVVYMTAAPDPLLLQESTTNGPGTVYASTSALGTPK